MFFRKRRDRVGSYFRRSLLGDAGRSLMLRRRFLKLRVLSGEYRDQQRSGYADRDPSRYGRLKKAFEPLPQTGLWLRADYLFAQ